MEDRAPITSSNVVPSPNSGQLRFFKAATLVLFLLLLGAVAYYEYRQHLALPVTILVNGIPVATVESMSIAAQTIRNVHLQQVGQEYMADGAPHFVENVTFQRAAESTLIDSADVAVADLSAATHTLVDADVVLVNGKPIVALPDAAQAQAAVDELRVHYAAMPPIAPLADKPTFIQNVTIERRTISASLTKRTADDAASILWTLPEPVMYTVLPHQTGWLISRKFKLSFADFLRANSNIDVDHIVPGDTVVVSKTFPPIDVVVKKIIQVDQKFGGTGVRQVTMEASYIDGRQTGTPITTNMVTVSRATLQNSVN